MLRRVGSVMGMMLVAGLLGGCNSQPIVGVILPSTGAAASYGESIESGIRLALADARAQEQIPEGFEVVWADTGSVMSPPGGETDVTMVTVPSRSPRVVTRPARW